MNKKDNDEPNRDKNEDRGFFKTVKDISTIGSSHLAAALISAAFWLYMATILQIDEYGRIGFLIAAATIAFTISHLGSQNTVIVYTAKEGKNQSSLYAISLISGAITSFIVFLIFYNLGVSLFIIGSVIFTLATSDLLGRKFYKNFSKYILTQRILLVSLAVILYFPLGGDGIILGFALSYFPYFLRVLKGFKHNKVSFGELKMKSRFILHSYSEELSRSFMQNLDILIVMPLFGFAVLGNYQLGIQFLLVLRILPQTVYQFLLPKYSTGYSNPKIKIGTIISSVALAILGFILAPLIVPVFFPQFTQTAEIIQIISFAIIPISINLMLNSEFLGRNYSKLVLWGAVVYVTVQIVCIIILGEIFGINGVAASLVLGATSQTIFLVLAGKFATKNT